MLRIIIPLCDPRTYGIMGISCVNNLFFIGHIACPDFSLAEF